ncbi:hypothetical protein SAMN03159439_01505 [Pseudomonas sp. NFACC04-2]|jgi:hypothetical protein|nr:hypothetical protein SAMN03159439_01505 [Pseudomonas sp. NFACC04-2]
MEHLCANCGSLFGIIGIFKGSRHSPYTHPYIEANTTTAISISYASVFWRSLDLWFGKRYRLLPVKGWEVSDISPRRVGRRAYQAAPIRLMRDKKTRPLGPCGSFEKNNGAVARELAPARLRSSRKPAGAMYLMLRIWQVLGPLRGPAGASSLATVFSITSSEQHWVLEPRFFPPDRY